MIPFVAICKAEWDWEVGEPIGPDERVLVLAFVPVHVGQIGAGEAVCIIEGGQLTRVDVGRLTAVLSGGDIPGEFLAVPELVPA